MKKIIFICLLMIGCSYPCPRERAVLHGSVYCNEQFKDVFVEIEPGELDNKDNYMDATEWEKKKESIIFDKIEEYPDGGYE